MPPQLLDISCSSTRNSEILYQTYFFARVTAPHINLQIAFIFVQQPLSVKIIFCYYLVGDLKTNLRRYVYIYFTKPDETKIADRGKNTCNIFRLLRT